MIRIFTYLTLDSDGEPTAAGTYFDPQHCDFDARMGKNTTVVPVRDGTQRRLQDPLNRFENNGTLIIIPGHSDLKSGSLYLGQYRYLAPVIYYHLRNNLPMCLFLESVIETHKKCYVIYFDDVAADLTGQATSNTDEQLVFERMKMSRMFNLPVIITLDGLYTNKANIATASWSARTSVT